MDKKIEKDIINCSRCGLCMEVCPVYKTKMTEPSALRGKFLQLLGLIKKELKYDKKISYNLDLCLACKKCKAVCPSGLDAVKIFSAVRAEYQTPFERVFYSAPVFKLKILAARFFLKPIKLPIPASIAHFKGCVARAVSGGKAKFKCCGLPFYVKGRLDLYEKYRKYNSELFEKYDKIIFDCASCYDTILNYENADKTKFIYFTDLYKDKALMSKTHLKVVFHKPCHLNSKTYESIKNLLNKIKNIDFIEFEGEQDCCGFGGDFFTRHLNTAAFLSKKKIENVIKSGANIVLTTCPACLWSLIFGIKAVKARSLWACDLAEFLGSLTEVAL